MNKRPKVVEFDRQHIALAFEYSGAFEGMSTVKSERSRQICSPGYQLSIQPVGATKRVLRVICLSRAIKVSNDMANDAGEPDDVDEVVARLRLAARVNRNLIVDKVELNVIETTRQPHITVVVAYCWWTTKLKR